MTSNTHSEPSIKNTLVGVFKVPSSLDNIEFLMRQSGLFDDYIMPEILPRKGKPQRRINSASEHGSVK